MHWRAFSPRWLGKYRLGKWRHREYRLGTNRLGQGWLSKKGFRQQKSAPGISECRCASSLTRVT